MVKSVVKLCLWLAILAVSVKCQFMEDVLDTDLGNPEDTTIKISKEDMLKRTIEELNQYATIYIVEMGTQNLEYDPSSERQYDYEQRIRVAPKKIVKKSIISFKWLLDHTCKTKKQITVLLWDIDTEVGDDVMNAYEPLIEAGQKVIILDVSNTYKKSNGLKLVDSANKVGELVASVLLECSDLSRFHLVGFGLGAHFAGFIGRHVKQASTNTQAIGRITGLDPTFGGSYQILYMIKEPVNASDATLVDLIHTSSSYTPDLASGTTNFWPNNHKFYSNQFQPQCYGDNDQCSHDFAVKLWKESINLEGLTKFPCVSAEIFMSERNLPNYFKRLSFAEITEMGLNTRPSKNKNFFCRTNGQYPYAKGIDGISNKQ